MGLAGGSGVGDVGTVELLASSVIVGGLVSLAVVTLEGLLMTSHSLNVKSSIAAAFCMLAWIVPLMLGSMLVQSCMLLHALLLSMPRWARMSLEMVEIQIFPIPMGRFLVAC